MPSSDDPFRPDPTRLRPRPGAGRRTVADAPPPRAATPFVSDAEPMPAAARALLGIGLNPLVQAASPLLLLTAQMRETVSSIDVPGLRRHTLEEIRRFEEQARSSGVPEKVVLSARYALCAGLDEAVLSTPWGHQSEWAQHPLLVQMHREAWGGEKFFDMLDSISEDPNRYIDLMELQYLELAFGFAGKYGQLAGSARDEPQQIQRGHERLADVQQDLYRKIRKHRGPIQTGLSLRWRGLEDRRNPLIRYIPWWVVAAAALPILAITFTGYYASLARAAAPVQTALAKVGLEDFSPAPLAAPVRGPTLKQLLASDEQSGVLRVEEQGSRTTVTLLARDLFPSGSAAVNPAYVQTLERLTNALNRVPGRVLVVGHTDDQPINSLRYQNNFELSRERAQSVVILLFVSIELITVTFYILTSFLRRRLGSLEAGVKYLILGGLSSAFMVYGIALVFGTTGKLNFHEISAMAATLTGNKVFLVGILFVLVGIGFKIAAFPAQIWAPDVYQGAPTPATAFLAVGSKAAGFVLLIRVLFQAVPAITQHWANLLVGISIISILYGNLCAIPQRNLKRLLGYSSISNAGYMLMGVAALSASGLSAVLYYLGGYLFTVLAAFFVICLVMRKLESEDIAGLAGLNQRSPLLAAALTLAMTSLAGIPPLAGFFGKFMLLRAVVEQGAANPVYYWLLAAAIFGVVISLYYYFGVVRAVYWSKQAPDLSPIEVSPVARTAVYVCMGGMLFLGLYPNTVVKLANSAVAVLGM